MATLEKIRTKGGILLAIFVGLALFAFIMTDMLSAGGSIFMGSRTEVASINGSSLHIEDFQNKVSEMEEFNKLNQGYSSLTEAQVYQLREQVWNQVVSQTLLSEKYKDVGISVTSEELKDMVSGKNIHPAILQHPIFANPQTGAFDKNQVINFLIAKQQDPTANFYWMVMEEQLINDQLFNKYKDLLKQGMYTPKAWQQVETESRNKQVSFDFAMARFSSVPDSVIAISDKEISQYYKANSDKYQQEASRDIEYIIFPIEPSEEDVQASIDWVGKMMTEIEKPGVDAIQFVTLNSDEPYLEKNYKLSELNSKVEEFLKTAKVGDVYGPYKEDEAYKATKFIGTVQVPDSAKARHILLQGESFEEANAIADSLINLIKKGSDFAALARKHSADQGSAINGGDLGWFTDGMMVKPFNDAVFYGKKGDVVKVESNFGIHIIDIQDLGKPSTKYNVATIVRHINFSSKTYHQVYTEANKFASLNNSVEKFNNAIEEENKTKRFGRNIRINDNSVGNLESSRELVKWAYDSSVGALSPAFEFGEQFIIAHLISSSEKGTTPLNKVKPQIERTLMNKKKAEYLTQQFESASKDNSDLNEIAKVVNGSVQSAKDITFNSYQVPGAGVEPALVSLALNSPVNTLSKPISGTNGVYMVVPTEVKDIEVEESNIENELLQNVFTKIDYQFLNTLMQNSDIVDKRHRFY